MPQKKKNAFYFFMLEFRENQKKLGVLYTNMKEVAAAAGPLWKNVSAEEKAKFVEMAKDSDILRKDPKNIKTSTGVTLAELQQREIDKKLAIEQEHRDIDEYVKNMGSGMSDAVFYVLDTNFLAISYAFRPPHYSIGESSLVSFSLREGIINCMHDIIRPAFRMGYHAEARSNCEYLGLEMPWGDKPITNYYRVLDKITDSAGLRKADGTMHPVFTRRERQDMVRCFLRTCCNHTGNDASLFRVWSVEYLLFALLCQLGFGRVLTLEYTFDLMLLDLEPTEQTEQDALKDLENRVEWYFRKDPFKYCPGMECERHYEVDKATKCTSNRAKRWAYIIMKHSCPPALIARKPGKHEPTTIV